MKTAFILALAGLSAAQLNGFDWAAIDAAGTPPTETVPLGVIPATTVKYNSETAIASIANDVMVSPLSVPTPEAVAPVANRLSRREACDPQPLGMGPQASPDTAQGFLDFPTFSTAASTANAPSGYVLAFSNAKGSIEGAGKLMGWAILDTYDVGVCAAKCDRVFGCRSFNLYYERAPIIVSFSVLTFPKPKTAPTRHVHIIPY